MTPLRKINSLVLSKVASKLLKQHNFTVSLSPQHLLSGTSSKKQALPIYSHKLDALPRSHLISHMKLCLKVKKIVAFLFEILKTHLSPNSLLLLIIMSLPVKGIIAERLKKPFFLIRLTQRPTRPGQSKTST